MPSFTIESSELAKGLRPSKRAPRNAKFLVESAGAVGRDGVLQALDELTRIDTSDITDAFPFPQQFVFINVIIICGLTTIYELVAGSLVLKHTASVAGSTWSPLDFHDYIYLSNGQVVVERSAGDKTYSEVTDKPTAMCACNFNGQVILGGPDVSAPGADLTIKADPLTVTLTQHGGWA